MLLLALDTSTAVVGAALHDGERVVAESSVLGARSHGEQLAPRVDAVLAAAGCGPRDLTEVVVGVGPGPFTGLRVGVVTGLTLGAALGVPVHGLCSLDALAWGSRDSLVDGPFVVVTDARRREVYWATYADATTRTDGPAVGLPADVATQAAGAPFVGPATELYDVLRPAVGDAASQLSPADLASLAVARTSAGLPLLEPRPLYLRRPDATPPGERKPVLT